MLLFFVLYIALDQTTGALFLLSRQCEYVKSLLYATAIQGFDLFIDVLVITAGHVTEPFEDWVAGHGELWSAQLLAAAVRQVHNYSSKLSLRTCEGGYSVKN